VDLEALHANSPMSGRFEADVDAVLERCDRLLRFAVEQGPELLAEEARKWMGEDASLARARLLGFWRADGGGSQDYLSRALLRPYVELLARLGILPDRERRQHLCPVCGGRPWIAARRPAAEADAALRLLGCALCGSDWPVGRIWCPGCGEQDPEKLASFTEKTHPAVRIEACQTCRRYVKSIDLTLDAHVIPEVDDLVSVGMDLWAAREGFARLEPGLAGI